MYKCLVFKECRVGEVTDLLNSYRKFLRRVSILLSAGGYCGLR